MAGQAILGETVLKSAMAMESAAAPTVETLVADHSRMVFRIAYSILVAGTHCLDHRAGQAAIWPQDALIGRRRTGRGADGITF